jgi:catechol 1,2-dioxygenase
MATNGTHTNGAHTNGTNGTNGHTANASKYDPDFTAHVIGLMAETTEPRHRQILSSLITHLHDFIRDVELTQDEWVLGVNYVNSIGQAYRKNRNEAWRICDVLGVES